MVEVLNTFGIHNAKDHIAAIRSWGTITFVMSKSSLQTNEINNIRSFCEQMMFDPAILPQLSVEERTRYNQFQDDLFFDYVDKIFSPERDALYADYDFNIKPATDNKPYFSQYIKWGSLSRLAQFFGNRSLPFFEIGSLLVDCYTDSDLYSFTSIDSSSPVYNRMEGKKQSQYCSLLQWNRARLYVC